MKDDMVASGGAFPIIKTTNNNINNNIHHPLYSIITNTLLQQSNNNDNNNILSILYDKINVIQQFGNRSTNPLDLEPSDPESPIDIAFFVIGCIIICLNIFFMLLVFTKFKRSAVKSKQPILMFISLIFSILMFIAYAINNRMFYNRTLTGCLIVKVWIFNIGIYGWIGCLTTRLITVYITFQLEKKVKLPHSIIVLLLLIPVIIYCIIRTAIDYQYGCLSYMEYAAISDGILIAIFTIVIIILIILTRRVRKEYNQTLAETTALIGFLLAAIGAYIIWILRLHYLIPIRIFISMVPVFLSSYYFYIYFGKLIYSILTCSSENYFMEWLVKAREVNNELKRKEYEEEFKDTKLRNSVVNFNANAKELLEMEDNAFII
ncbi:hypothetical protein ABK040_007938 [Willaertia magna]